MDQLKSISASLAVIGFDARLDGLDNIDFVEAALYCGEALNNAPLHKDQHADLIEASVMRVLSANQLQASAVEVILVTQSLNNSATDAFEQTTKQKGNFRTVNSLASALLLASRIIEEQNKAVLITAIQTTKPIKSVENATISFDDAFAGYASKQGVASLLIASTEFAVKAKSYVYATIEALASQTEISLEGATIDLIKQALTQANITADSISSIEVSASDNDLLSNFEQRLLLENYSTGRILSTSMSCHKSVLGENGSLSEILGLINTVINLQQRYRSGIKDWRAPKSRLPQWENSNFYIFNQAAPVFPSDNGEPRYCAYSCINDVNASHIILKENADQLAHSNGFNACSAQTLFILSGVDETALLAQLKRLEKRVEKRSDTHNFSDSFKTLASELYQNLDIVNKYKITLIADSFIELEREIKLAKIGVIKAFEQRSDWKTPKGSYFTSQPNDNAKVAFLYPGIGATYIGLGRDLFHLFPEIYPNVIKIADNIGASLKDELLNPRSVVALDFKALKKQDLALRNDLANIAECGVGYACVFTKIFEDVFKIKADFATGYSMGEISMFAALGCWQKPGLMSARLAASDTFNHQLSNELRAIRKLWNLPEVANGTFEQIWETYAIKGTLSQVNAAIENDERVFVTIINTTDSLVIGGYPEDCLKVIKRLGIRAMPMNMANAIHSQPAYQEYENMLALYSMEVTERITTKMISSSCYLPIPQMQKAIAVSISKCLCEVVDFPRLINTLANRGASVFIEMGAGRSLSSWTDKILKEADKKTNHISVPINAKGTNDQLSYARAVAKLVSYGVDVNIDSFFNGSIIKQL